MTEHLTLKQYEWITNDRSPRQHWLYYGTRLQGTVYKVNPKAFTVYIELPDGRTNVGQRRWVAQMDTLDEAKDLLLTLVGSRQ